MAELMVLIYGMPFILIGVGAYVGSGAGGMEASYDPEKNAAPLILFSIAGVWILLLVLCCTNVCKKKKKNENEFEGAGRQYRNFINQEM